MDALPFEIITDILSYLPPSHSKKARLTSRKFNAALAKSTFNVLASFINPEIAQSTLEAMAADLRCRPRAIWSPHCSIPRNLPIPENFLLAMHVALRGASWPGEESGSYYSWPSGRESSDSEESYDMEEDRGVMERITARNFGQLIGREHVTEDNLRQALFRYSLYLSYIHDRKGDAQYLWVLNERLWCAPS